MLCEHVQRKQLSLTTNLQGGLKFEQDRLAEEDLPGFEAKSTDFILCQLNILTRSGAFHFGETDKERSLIKEEKVRFSYSYSNFNHPIQLRLCFYSQALCKTGLQTACIL